MVWVSRVSTWKKRYLPSGNLTQLWKITVFNGKSHYFNGHCSQLCYQLPRVALFSSSRSCSVTCEFCTFHITSQGPTSVWACTCFKNSDVPQSSSNQEQPQIISPFEMWSIVESAVIVVNLLVVRSNIYLLACWIPFGTSDAATAATALPKDAWLWWNIITDGCPMAMPAMPIICFNMLSIICKCFCDMLFNFHPNHFSHLRIRQRFSWSKMVEQDPI